MPSSGNICTLNPLTQPNSGTFSEGNLLFTHTASAWRTTAGTHGITSGKWYWEAYQYEQLGGNGFPCGIYDIDSGLFVKQQASDYPGQSNSTYGTAYMCYTNTGTYATKRTNGVSVNTTLSMGDSGDVWQCAFDADNGKIWFGKNNTWDNGANPALGSNESYASIPSSTWVPVTCSYNDSNSENYPQNFGQDSTFAGRISAGGNADDNGFGDFKYAPPAGFLAICTGNLPISADIDVAQTNTDGPHQQFNSIVYSGNGTSNNAITGLGFQPDFVWIKDITNTAAYGNNLIDSTRGRAKVSYSSRSQSELTSGATQDLKSFDSDGITLGTSTQAAVNTSSHDYVVWAWRANGGTPASNTQGSTNSTTQANTKAGFSIVTYTGIAGASGSSTVGHGLTQAPEFILHVSRTRSAGRWVQHMATSGSSYVLSMSSSAETDYSSYGTIASPTATTFGINGIDGIGGESADYVAYVWHSVPGFSKFGQYIGNGNNDGPYIYTGFRVAMIAFKRVDGGSEPWTVFDNKRATYNPTSAHSYSQVYWNSTAGASSGSTHSIDFLSNGVKLRGNGGANNASDGVYAYCAWGDVSFKYNNTF